MGTPGAPAAHAAATEVRGVVGEVLVAPIDPPGATAVVGLPVVSAVAVDLPVVSAVAVAGLAGASFSNSKGKGGEADN